MRDVNTINLQGVQALIEEVLQTAKENNLTSLALPHIEISALEHSPSTTAEGVIGTTLDFLNKNSETNPQEVLFVIHPISATIYEVRLQIAKSCL